MRKVIRVLLFFLMIYDFTNCSRKNVPSDNKVPDIALYNVYKIDSINSYYLIYVNQAENKYKVISPKSEQSNCKKIELNNSYELKLQSIFIVNGKQIIPTNGMYELSGWKFDDSTTIDFEKGMIWGLFLENNIKGLCFVAHK